MLSSLRKSIIILVFLLLPSLAFAGTTSTSGVTAQTLITRIQLDLNDTSSDMWTSTDYIRWLDEAVRVISIRTGILEKTVQQILLVTDQYSYDISFGFQNIETIYYDSGVTDSTSLPKVYSLKREPLNNLNHGKVKGYPQHYSVWANDLLIWPTPGSAQSGTTLNLYVANLPSGVTATTSSIETPVYCDMAILYYVKAKAYFKDKRENLGNYYMILFDKEIQAIIQNVGRRYLREE